MSTVGSFFFFFYQKQSPLSRTHIKMVVNAILSELLMKPLLNIILLDWNVCRVCDSTENSSFRRICKWSIVIVSHFYESDTINIWKKWNKMAKPFQWTCRFPCKYVGEVFLLTFTESNKDKMLVQTIKTQIK